MKPAHRRSILFTEAEQYGYNTRVMCTQVYSIDIHSRERRLICRCRYLGSLGDVESGSSNAANAILLEVGILGYLS